MSVTALVQLALARNEALSAVRQRTTEAQGLLRQARLGPRPSIDVDVTAGRPLGSAGEHGFSIGYAHVFELGGKAGRRADVAEHGLELARLEIADRERQIRAEVKSLYADALAARRSLEMATRVLTLAERGRTAVAHRVRLGDASALDEGLLTVEVARLRADQLRFRAEAERAMLELRTLVGLDASTPLSLDATSATPEPVSTSLDAMIARALEQRPDLRAARREEEMRRAEVQLARTGAIPDVVGSIRYSQSQSRFEQLAFGPDGELTGIRDRDRVLTAGISIALPLQNRNHGNIQAAQARADAARLRREYLERAVRNEVRAAYVQYQAARRALDVLRTQATAQSTKNLELVRASYSLGETRLLDFVTEQRRVIDVQQAYTGVLREHAVALAALEQTVGVPVRRVR